ncbi:hypothetical protein F5B20DRAFT_255969 [Whalleya microplaca]|nr:hypothetical protein F5B20DRAFT_255969 [Whalleya microplaca]
MWILENEGEAFDGKRLWLRPGKRYLFGRTVAEPGQLAIKGNGADKVSRKHVTIQVDRVVDGDAENMNSRSRVTVEDLGSKGGTKVNDRKFKGDKCHLEQDANILQMGSFPAKFRITWYPIVLSFSFTSNQLRANPLAKLRQDLEQLDIKFLADYDAALTTHVVSKKRNTPKGLQALINGRHIVNDGFVNAVITAATPDQPGDGVATCALERDFDGNWPDAIQFLPPPGDEPVPRSTEDFAPSPDRENIFEGYTFIFYNKKQYDNLLGPITTGKGKALLREVVAGETQINDFIRYVKEIAGEKGLGEFEDGSEGKGVVVVRWIPNTPENADWFTEFYTSISLRLDHRLIDQKDFLGAILSNDASGLRRPLEVESEPHTSQAEPQSSAAQQPMDVDENPPPEPSQRPATRRRERGPIKSRFKGFIVDLDDDDLPEHAPAASVPSAVDVESSQEGLFVSQDAASQEPEETIRAGRQSQRKRPAPAALGREDVMDDFAPTAAQVKRRRIAAGEDPIPRQETPATTSASDMQKSKSKTPTPKKEVDILDLARQHREEAEQRAKAEREELATAPEDLDLAEIRRLQIEEPMELRPPPSARTREQDIADGRWDPAWNGRKNFKKFQQRGAAQGRAPQKIIVALKEAKTKGFGIGDDYWLEDEGSQQRHSRKNHSNNTSQRTQGTAKTTSQSAGESQDRRRGTATSTATTNGRASRELPAAQKRTTERLPSVAISDDEDDDMVVDNDEDDVVVMAPPPARSTRAPSQKTTQSQAARSTRSTSASTTTSSRTGKRPAPPPAREQPAKRSRVVSVADSDDDESDDELRFRFGKR